MHKIKKIILAFLLTILLAGSGFGNTVHAASTSVTGGTNGPFCNSGGYFTPASTTIADGDTITFSVPANDPYAGGIQVNGFGQGSFVVPRGGSVTTAALHANVSYQGTWPNSPGCIKGSGTITVQTPTPTPTPTPIPTPTPSPGTPSASSSTRSNTSKTTPTVPGTTSQTATPLTVVADTVTVNGNKITSLSDLTVSQDQKLKLYGHTVPNGQVTLTIHSNPTTTNVTADSSGNWNYTVSGLAPGTHTIDAIVNDPATKQTSPNAKLLSFTVKARVADAAITQASPKKKSPILLIGLGALMVVLAVALALFLRIKRRKALLVHPDEPLGPPSSGPIPPTSGPSPPPDPNNPTRQ